MTELATPASTPGDSQGPEGPAKSGWTGEIRMPDLWDQLTPGFMVTFAKIIIARRHTRDEELRDEARAAEVALRQRFVQQHGDIQNAYYCTNIVGGCALTEKVTKLGRRQAVSRTLHTVLNRAAPELVALEATCIASAVRADTVLHGRPSLTPTLRVTTDAVYSAMTRVLRAADESAAPMPSPHAEQFTRAAIAEVAQAERIVAEETQREGSFTYFQGVLGGAVLTIVLCTLLGIASARNWATTISTAGFVGAVVFGALGAVTSVFQRISADRIILTFTPSRLRLLALGSLRPLIGSTFGAVAYFGVVGGIVQSGAASANPAASFGLAAIVGFTAGFSERFATDVVKRVESSAGTPK